MIKKNDETAVKPALWTKDFIFAGISNLLLSVSFYMLLPVLPFYLIDVLGTSGSVTGIVLSLYTVAALMIRPFSGYIVDTFSRKPLYLVCYGLFVAVMAGYVVAASLTFFIILRIMHGFAFGLSTVSGNTLAIDIMPAQRRGEGIGYYGMSTNIAMAIGPATGLWIYQGHSFEVFFLSAFAIGLLGFIVTIGIKAPKRETVTTGEKQPLSLDRFILLRALPCALLLFAVAIGYGSMTNYIGLYCESNPSVGSAGVFFIVVSAGIVIARLLSARSLNDGKIVRSICIGTLFFLIAYLLFTFFVGKAIFYLSAFLFGTGFGYISPAFQTLFINMAEHNQRGTANATFFTVFDFGIGLGIATGSLIIERLNFQWLFAICGMLVVLSFAFFFIVSAPYFEKHKLR